MGKKSGKGNEAPLFEMPPLNAETGIRFGSVGLVVLLFLFGMFIHEQAWVSMEADMQLGPVEATLSADIYPYKAEYNATIDTSSVGGIGGGIAGGVGGGGGGAGGGGNISREGTNVFGDQESRERFMDNVGLIYNSYKSRFYDLEFYGWGDEQYRVHVEVLTSQTPWWVEGVETECWVEITLAEDYPDVAKLEVESVDFQIWYDYDETANDYQKVDSVWSSNELKSISSSDDMIEYRKGIMPPSGKNLIGFTVIVTPKITLTDNTVLTSYLKPWASGGHPVTINVNTMKTVDATGVVLFLSSNYIFMLSMGMSVLAAVFAGVNMKRTSAVMFFIAGGMAILAMAFFYIGLQSLTEILAQPLTSDRDFGDSLTYQFGYFLGYLMGVAHIAIGIGHVVSYSMFSNKETPKKTTSGKKAGKKKPSKAFIVEEDDDDDDIYVAAVVVDDDE